MIKAGEDLQGYRLSAAQRGVWGAAALDDNHSAYNIAEYFEIPGAIDPVIFERSLRRVVEDADALRLRICDTPEGPQQYVAAKLDWKMSFVDLCDENDPATAADAWMRRDVARPTDIGREPVFAYALLRLAPNRFVWYGRYHHICIDGVGLSMVAHRVASIYSALVESRPVEPSPFASSLEALEFDRSYRLSSDYVRDRGYWRTYLENRPAALTLSGKPPARSKGFLRCTDWVSRSTIELLRARGGGRGAGLAAVIMSASGIYLHRLTGEPDVTLGMAVSGRRPEAMRNVVALCSNAVPLRLPVSPGDTVADVLSRTTADIREASRYQRYRLEDLRNDCGLRPSDPGIYGTIVNVMPFDYDLNFAGNKCRVRNIGNWSVDDLQIAVYDRRDEADVCVEFIGNPQHYTAEILGDHLRNFCGLLEQFGRTGDEVPLRRIEMLTPSSRRKVIEGFNKATPGVRDATLPDLFEARAELGPSEPALIAAGETLTYADLNRRANCLAHYLIARGAGPESLVGICLPQSAQMVVAVLAVLKAGAAYLPLDPLYPARRLREISIDAKPALALTSGALSALFDDTPLVVVDAPDIVQALASAPSRNPRDTDRNCALRCQNPAYVIYTSGSTGKPKGVVVTHAGIASLAAVQAPRLDLKPGSRVLQFASLNFDASLWEFVMSLTTGGALVLADDEARGGEALCRLLLDRKVTHALLPPVVLSTIEEPSALPLQCLIVGGEACSAAVASRWSGGRRMVNAYGPTESTVCATISEPLCGDEAPPIGRPVWNTRAYVLDAALQAAPVGVSGELYVAGSGLARGYLNRPGMTAERFVADPQSPAPGGRMYRTGDLARWRSDGTLEFVGRADRQVKIRGFRIEPGEIEATLRCHERVRDALVAVSEKAGQKQLLGYAIARRKEVEEPAGQHSEVALWREIYETTYAGSAPYGGDFDITGWQSSYTGLPIPPDEMRIWVDETVASLRRLRPSLVAEIGCGTGLLLTRLAAECESYTGLDFSSEAIAKLGRYLAGRRDLTHVELRPGLAHDLSFLPDDSIDLLVLNSIVQYFPDTRYLLDVLNEAARVTRRGGNIFIGDVRSLPLSTAFHASVELHKAGAGTPLSDLKERLLRAELSEKELLVAPRLFTELARRHEKLSRAEVSLKAGAYDNELSRFRYDVTIAVGDRKEEIAEPRLWVKWSDGDWREAVESALSSRQPVGVYGVPDRRVAASVEAAHLLTSQEADSGDAAGLRDICGRAQGEDPDAAIQFARRLGVELSWRGFGKSGVYDLVFRPKWIPAACATAESPAFYEPFTNSPSRGVEDAELGRELERYLCERLPEYMLPSAVVVLPAWPLTPSGKVDRQALPIPGRTGRESDLDTYRPPGTRAEKILCELFAEMLSLDRVGLDDNFFRLGGDSIVSIQLAARARRAGLELSSRDIFQHPTVESLARAARSVTGEEEAAEEEAGEEETGEQSPLDFSLVDLTPAQIESLEAANPGLEEILPLSPLQEGFLFHALYDESAPDVYTVQVALHLEGQLDSGRMRRACEALLGRHASLRAAIRRQGLPRPVQVIPRGVSLAWREYDMAPKGGAEEFLAADRAVRLNVEDGLIRFAQVRLGPDSNLLVVTHHHLLLDGWSMPLLFSELMALYANGGNALALPRVRPYRDYLAWLAWQDRSAAEEAWRTYLAGLESATRVGEGSAPKQPASRWEKHLPQALTSKLQQVGQEHGLTLNTILQGMWGVLLGKLTGLDDVVFGSVVSGRGADLPGVEQMVGLFINTVPVRVRLNAGEKLSGLWSTIQQGQSELLGHQHLGLADIQRAAGLGHLFDTLMVFENYPLSTTSFKSEAADIRVTGFELISVNHYPLSLTVVPGERLYLRFDYDSVRFGEGRGQEIAERFVRLLESAAERPAGALWQLEALEREERLLLDRFNDTAHPLALSTLPELFEAQVLRTPEAHALVFGTQRLTYSQLNGRANRLAHHLIGLGIGPESLVGLCFERSFDLLVAMLGVLKAGAAYLPLDPGYPESRLRFMLEDAAPAYVLSLTCLRERAPKWSGVVDLDAPEIETALADESTDSPTDLDRTCPLRPQHPAYVMYTSGSSGRPKGVVGTTQGVVNRLCWAWRQQPFQESEVCCNKTTVGFVDHVAEIFAPLLQGVPLVLLRHEEVQDTEKFVAVLARENVTRVVLAPSLLEPILEQDDEALRRLCVNHWVSSGEALLAHQAARFFAKFPSASLYNIYGSTEAAADATAAVVDRDRVHESGSAAISIGSPISNFRTYVLDSSLSLVSVGTAGELYVAGPGLARGYLKKPGMTADRFVADPYGLEPGGRMYRTGDLARWRKDGELEFLGRADQQVKIRGVRIELGEIEAILRAQPTVTQAAVALRDDSAGQKLVAYIVPAAETVPDEEALRQAIGERLPQVMIPAAIVVLDALPMTPNGKLDRRALPAPHAKASSHRAPRTPEEQVICGIFAELLQLVNVGIDDDFFKSGGHSLLATQAASRIRGALSVDVTVRTVFEAPTPLELAGRLRHQRNVGEPLTRQSRPARIPLSFAQQRLWFIDQLQGASPEYNIPDTHRLRGALNVQALERSIQAIVERHEILRTHFLETDGQPAQVVSPASKIGIPIDDLSGLSEAAKEKAIVEALERQWTEAFHLATGPLLRVKLVRLAERDHILLCTCHHIVSDGWSMNVFNRELAVLYEAFSEGRENPLPPLTVQYADFALWELKWVDEDAQRSGLEYWKGQLANIPKRLQLAAHRPSAAAAGTKAGKISVFVPPGLASELRKLGASGKSTLYMTMLSAFAVLLSRYAAQDDIVVGSPIANRRETQLEQMIGFFVNALAMRIRVNPAETFAQLLAQVRNMTLDAYRRQEIPFERVVDNLSIERDLDRTPVFQVVFALHSASGGAGRLKDIEMERLIGDSLLARFDLELHAIERDGGIELLWVYKRDLFDALRIEQMARHFLALLVSLPARSNEPVSRLPLLDDTERRELLEQFNGAPRAKPAGALAELFEQHAARDPNALAVICGEQRLTYGELNARANRVARRLRNLGLKRGGMAAIRMERGPEMIVAILGIIKAGGAYVPLDLTYPTPRLISMLRESGAGLLLTTSDLPALPGSGAAPVFVDAIAASVAEGDTASELAGVLDLAYVMFTSGSTGEPKGVGLTQGGVIGLVRDCGYLDWLPGDRVAQVANTSFDAAPFEIWGALLNGGVVTILPRETTLSPVALGRALHDLRIDTLLLTTGLFNEMAREAPASFTNLRTLFFGGDVADPHCVRAVVAANPRCRVINAYGPTENTTLATWYPVTSVAAGALSVPIGGPIGNTRVYVLDAGMQLAPVGVTGELYLAGAGLARGYLGHPALTAERFVADPFALESGGRMYRTGDLVRWRAGGALEFLGRADRQIKIRGFRIEPGEIEAALQALPGVAQAAVVGREDSPGRKQLVAYVKGVDGSNCDSKDLRRALSERLPEYMIPSAWVTVDEMALTPNGKLDRKALRAPELPFERYRAPRTPDEQRLCCLFAQVLGLDKVGLDDDFFDIGGHSLLATVLVSRIRGLLGLELLVRDIFLSRTVARLLVICDALRAAPVEPLASSPLDPGAMEQQLEERYL